MKRVDFFEFLGKYDKSDDHRKKTLLDDLKEKEPDLIESLEEEWEEDEALREGEE